MTRACASVVEARGSFSRGFLDAGSPASLDNPGDYATCNRYQPSDGTHGEPERPTTSVSSPKNFRVMT